MMWGALRHAAASGSLLRADNSLLHALVTERVSEAWIAHRVSRQGVNAERRVVACHPQRPRSPIS